MRAASLAIAATITVLVARPRCQEAFLPVQDLLYERVDRSPYLEILRTEELIGSRYLRGEGYLGGFPRIEWQGRLLDHGGSGWFTRNQLAALFPALGLERDCRVFGGALVVAERDVEAATEILRDLRRALPPALTIDLELREKTGEGMHVWLARTVDARPGRLSVVSEVAQRSAVIGYNVEIAQASMICNPMISDERAGVMVALRPQLAPSGAWALLEVVARCVETDREAKIDSGHKGIGAIDRVPQRISEVGRVVLVRPGVHSVQRWSDGEREFELALSTQWQLQPAMRVAGHDFAVYSVRGPLQGFRSVRIAQSREDDMRGQDPEIENGWDDIEALAGPEAEWLEPPDSDEAPDGERYVAVGRASFAAGAAVMRWFESKTAGPELAVHCYDVAAGTAWPGDGSVPDGARLLGRTELSQVEGTWSATAIRTDQSLLRDWDVEVAQSARIPRPVLERVGAGFVLNLRRTGEVVEVEVDLARLLDTGGRSIALSAPIYTPAFHRPPSGDTGPKDDPAVGLPPDSVRVEHPQIAMLPFGFSVRVADQATVTRRTSAGELLGAGRELLVVVQRRQ
ncbi:MAG: hypothetical protein KDE27_08300 [Planctomycetes bacterium]|nr:hypothetical protein [Planctomycetota bacterium]